MKHAAMFAQKTGKKKVTAAAKVKAKVQIGGTGKADSAGS
jgi:hypothetical protein